MQFTIAGFEDLTSPFDLVQRILAAKAFADAPSKDVAEGDSVLGVMTDEEKAIFSANKYTIDHLGELVLRLREITQRGESTSPDGPSILSLCEQTEKWIEVLRNLLWTTIATRFAEQLQAAESDNIGIRSGFQVVLKEEDEVNVGALFNDLNAMLGGADISVGIEEHHCTECQHYDGCSLPFKISREAPATNPTAP